MTKYTEFSGEKITICLTSACNIKCKHCYIDYSGAWDIQELKELIPIWRQKYKVSLNGAEPLTNLEYLNLYSLAGYHNIFTNGKAIVDNPNIMEHMKRNGIDHVAISYHLGSEVSPLSTQMVERAIFLLVNSGFEVEIMTTISKQNYKQIDSICDKALELGAKQLYLLNYIKKGNGVNGDKYVLSADEIKEFVTTMTRIREKYPKEQLYIQRAGLFDSQKYITKDCFECYACRHAVITPEKKIYPCIFCIDANYQIGHLEGQTLLVSPSSIDALPLGNGCLACNIYNGQYL